MAKSIIALSIQKQPVVNWILGIFLLGLLVAIITALLSNNALEASVPKVNDNLILGEPSSSSSTLLDGNANVPSVNDTTAALWSSSSSNPPHVIVIGAGAAGLSAAYTLDYLNVNYTLLEANTQIGGRTKEIPQDALDLDVPLDAGAEWLHVGPRILKDLLLYEEDRESVETNAKTIRYRPQTYGIYARHYQRRRDFMRHFYQEHKFYNTTWFSYFNDYMYPYVADQAVLNAVVDHVEILQKTAPEPGETSVRVSTKDGKEYIGSHVIVTVPIAILQERSIRFQPDLPVKQWSAIDHADMTYGIKVWLEFEKRFYLDIQMTGRLLGFLFDSDEMYFDGLYRKPSKRNVLTMFNVGHHAEKYMNLPDDEIFSLILQKLNHIMDNDDASKYFIRGYVQQWTTEPFTRGAYTVNRIDQHQIGKPLPGNDGQNRVYFAGEHLGGAWHQATVHGAAISGRQAVLRMVEDIQAA